MDFSDMANFDYMAWRQEMMKVADLEELNLSSRYSDIVTGPSAVTLNTTGNVFVIKTPAGQYITILGEQHAQSKNYSAYPFAIKITNSSDIEITNLTQVHIYKKTTSGTQKEIGTWTYGELRMNKTYNATSARAEVKTRNEWFRFPQSIKLPSQTSLVIELINPDVTTDTSTVRCQMSLHVDLWTPKAMGMNLTQLGAGSQ